MKIDYQKRIFGLDVMRAAAILFVVFSHVLWIFPERSGTFVDILRFLGVMGVEIFFVLSGFLIGRILFKIISHSNFKISDLKYFLIRRWFRTLPNYYLALLINIGIIYILGKEQTPALWKYFFFLQNTFEGMDIFFTESWSLPIEEFAYIIGPLLFYILVLFRLPLARKKVFLVVTLVIILFFTITKISYNFKTPVSDLNYWNIHLKAVVLYRIDAIYYGVLAAYISLTKPKLWTSQPEALLLIALVFFTTFHYLMGALQLQIETNPFLWNVLYFPIGSICIALSLPFFSQWKTKSLLILKPITFISIVSYGMYLLHYSIILRLMRHIQPIENLSFNQKIIFAMLYFVLTLSLSYLLYRLYEKPMMDIRDRPLFKKYFKIKP